MSSVQANRDAVYWMALAHLPKWGAKLINSVIVTFHHTLKISIEEFFSLPETEWAQKFQLSTKHIQDLQTAKSELASLTFLAEDYLNQGYELLPITSPEYPKTLKENLKATLSPPLLYIKGNKQILQEDSIAIVGSRNAGTISLEFTDSIARMASEKFKVVVSGFAKGVDKQALDSAIKYTGQSIIVLPQGIMTFGSGFKQYYSQITAGNVLVLSTFFPRTPWRTELAMARNTTIYGLAKEIYVAESSEKGGTWSGALDGLRRGRNVYVRYPLPEEMNANKLLIEKGCTPVDEKGAIIPSEYKRRPVQDSLFAQEPGTEYIKPD